MPHRLNTNQIATIALTVEEMKDRDHTPIYIEGDAYVAPGVEPISLDPSEAARQVVEEVLSHPLVLQELEERDRLWAALKWVMENAEGVPFPDDPLVDNTLTVILAACELDRLNP